MPQTPRAKKVIEYAIAESRKLHHNYVGTEHMLLGLLCEEEGVAATSLNEPSGSDSLMSATRSFFCWARLPKSRRKRVWTRPLSHCRNR